MRQYRYRIGRLLDSYLQTYMNNIAIEQRFRTASELYASTFVFATKIGDLRPLLAGSCPSYL